MSSRTLALGLAAAAVIVLGVYLFVEVRAEPAPPPPAVATEHPRPAPPPTPPPDPAQAPLEAPHPRVRTVPQIHDTAHAQPPIDRGVVQAPDQMMRANPQLDEIAREANKAYDDNDYTRAREIALQVLAKQPGNVRMLRVMVSSACMDGDAQTAQTYYNQLPPGKDRADMRTRCGDKMGITFTEPAP